MSLLYGYCNLRKMLINWHLPANQNQVLKHFIECRLTYKQNVFTHTHTHTHTHTQHDRKPLRSFWLLTFNLQNINKMESVHVIKKSFRRNYSFFLSALMAFVQHVVVEEKFPLTNVHVMVKRTKRKNSKWCHPRNSEIKSGCNLWSSMNRLH